MESTPNKEWAIRSVEELAVLGNLQVIDTVIANLATAHTSASSLKIVSRFLHLDRGIEHLLSVQHRVFLLHLDFAPDVLLPFSHGGRVWRSKRGTLIGARWHRIRRKKIWVLWRPTCDVDTRECSGTRDTAIGEGSVQ